MKRRFILTERRFILLKRRSVFMISKGRISMLSCYCLRSS